jgi:hypothetical protein
MADQNRNNFSDFRRVIEERMSEYAREIEGLEAKLKEEKEKAHRVSLEITDKPPISHVQVVPTIQHSNQFLEVLEPVPAPAVNRVTVTKEVTLKTPTPVTSPVKPKVVVPLPPTADEPEEEEAEVEEEEEADDEAEAEEEEEEEPEPEENYEQIRIKKTNYWLETISRKVYQITAEGDVGDLVANYKLVNGVATLAPL